MGLKASPTPAGRHTQPAGLLQIEYEWQGGTNRCRRSLWQCAAKHATDNFVSGKPHAGTNWVCTSTLHFLRSICRWKVRLYFDGMNNPNKRFEDDRREQRINNATDDYGRIKHTHRITWQKPLKLLNQWTLNTTRQKKRQISCCIRVHDHGKCINFNWWWLWILCFMSVSAEAQSYLL